LAVVTIAKEVIELSKPGDGMQHGHIAMSLFGLRGLDGRSEAVRRLVAALAVKIRSSVEEMTAPSAALAVAGLARLSSDHIGTHSSIENPPTELMRMSSDPTGFKNI